MNYKTAFLLLVSALPAAADIVINEVDSDTPSTDTLEFVELYNTDGGSSASLDGYVLVFYNGSNDQSYAAYDLDGHSIPPNGYFVIGNSGVAGATITFADNFLQNGADAVALYLGDATSFPANTPVTATNLVDAIVYDTNDSDDAGLLGTLGQAAQYNEDENGDKDNQSISRVPDGGATIATVAASPNAANPSAGGALTISLDASTMSEDGSTFITGTVSVSSAVTGDLEVTVALSDATEAQTFNTTISDGTTEGLFFINVVDDAWPDGDQLVTVTVSAPTYTDDVDTFTVTDDDVDFQLVINEANNFIPGTSTDVNGDGNADFGDEFVEIVNVSPSTVDLSFYAIRENGFDGRGDVHVFPEGTLLAPGAAIVVFSGGNVVQGTNSSAFGTAEIQLASSGGLFLSDTGDTIQLVDAFSQEVASMDLPDQTSPATNSSYTLATDEDYSSGYILHTASAGGGIASPGTMNDGTPFVVVSQGLTVTINTATVVENDPTATNAITITLPATSVDPTIVHLSSSDIGELIVPESVTIPPSTLSVDVDVTPVDDIEPDGSQLVTIQAIASGYLNGSGSITVDDDGLDVPAFTDLVINEIDPNQTGTDTAEFIELYNNTAETQSLNGLIILLYNGSNDTLYGIYDLSGYSIGPNGFFVLGNAGVPGAQITLPSNGLQNGQDGIALVAGNVADFTSGDSVSNLALTGATIIDALVYSGADTGLQDALDPSGSSISDTDTDSISRATDGGSGLSSGSFVLQTPTPNATNVLPAFNYGTWETDNLVTEGPDGDDDDDGIKNIIEYALGLDPHAFESLASAFDGSALTFTAGAEAVTNGDLIYSIETSPDLMDPWTPVVIGLDGSNMISYTLPTGETKIFARLRIDQAP